MKKIVDNLEELSDSKEILSAKEPDFVLIIILIILMLLLLSFIWMWSGEIDIVVKARGIVRPAENVSILRNMYGGPIKEIHFKQGKMVKKGESLLQIKNTDLVAKKANILKRINDIKIKIKKLTEFKKCLIGKQKFVDTKSKYYSRYQLYKTEYKQLKISFIKAKDIYEREKMLNLHATTESKLKELKLNYQDAELNLRSYKNKNINLVNEEIYDCKTNLSQLQNKLVDINKSIGLCHLRAPITGNIEVMENINSGDFIPVGIKIARIIPKTEDNYKVIITVRNKDIGKLKEGQAIKYRFTSLPYREYGILTGKITDISSDAALVEDKSNLNYKIEGSIKDIKLADQRGKVKYIKTGMITEARIVTGKKKIIYYVLQKLDFIP